MLQPGSGCSAKLLRLLHRRSGKARRWQILVFGELLCSTFCLGSLRDRSILILKGVSPKRIDTRRTLRT